MSGEVRVLVTGFGPFEGVSDNASGKVALALAGMRWPEVAGLGVRVTAEVLPTSFERARYALEAAVEARDPHLLVLLGVAPSEHVRVELRASGAVTSARPDVDGEVWEGRELGPARETSWPLDELVPAWAGVAARVGLGLASSNDCGGYVCNATYHAALGLGRPSLFVHIPQASEAAAVDAKAEVVAEIVRTLIGRTVDTMAGPRGIGASS